jgi:hypothetical protein
MQPLKSSGNPERISGPHAQQWVARGFGLIWGLISWPIIVVLATLEPFVHGILYGFALFGVLAAVFLRYVGHRTEVPLFTVFAISLGCLVAAGLYRGLLRFLATTTNAWR